MKKILTVLIVMLLVYSCSNESNRENDSTNKFLITYIDSLELEFKENIRFDSLKYSPFYSSYIRYKEYSDSLKLLYNNNNESIIERVEKSYFKALDRLSVFGFESSNFIKLTEQLIDNRKSYSESEYINGLLIRDVFVLNELRNEVTKSDFKFDKIKVIVEGDFCNAKEGDTLDFIISTVGISSSLDSNIIIMIKKQRLDEKTLSFDTIIFEESGEIVYRTIAGRKGKHTFAGIYSLPVEKNSFKRLQFKKSYEVK